MKPIFEPSDFIKHIPSQQLPCNVGVYATLTPNEASVIANEKLDKLIEGWPVVYGKHWYMENTKRWNEFNFPNAEFVARLAFIEPIKRECKHEIDLNMYGFWGLNTELKTKCKHCGAELEATWKVKGEL